MDERQTSFRRQLEELENLWIDASSASLQRIPPLCGEIEESAAANGFPGAIDPILLRRIDQLATHAGNRLAECLSIQSRTGTYSMNGSLESLSRVATTGWEG